MIIVLAIVRRMTPLGLQIYNTRRLPSYGGNYTVESDEDEDEYYDRIGEEGVLPSENLRACYSCAVTVVNGQFYGYWKNIIEDGLLGCKFFFLKKRLLIPAIDLCLIRYR